MSDDPAAHAHALVSSSCTTARHSWSSAKRRSPGPAREESKSVEAERLLYFGLVGAIEAGLVRTAEDVLTVLRQASQPLGPMGQEWLKQQGVRARRKSVDARSVPSRRPEV